MLSSNICANYEISKVISYMKWKWHKFIRKSQTILTFEYPSC